MTYKEAEKYLNDNRHKVLDFDKINGQNIQMSAVIIAPNTRESRALEKIHKSYLEGQDNKYILETNGYLDSDLNVFYIGLMNGDNIIMPLVSYLAAISSI